MSELMHKNSHGWVELDKSFADDLVDPSLERLYTRNQLEPSPIKAWSPLGLAYVSLKLET